MFDAWVPGARCGSLGSRGVVSRVPRVLVVCDLRVKGSTLENFLGLKWASKQKSTTKIKFTDSIPDDNVNHGE